MATPDPDKYVRAQNGLVALAVRDLRTFWERLDHSDPLKVRAALEAFWPSMLGRYGEIAATLAVDRFEDLSGLPGVMVRPVDPDRAIVRMRWAMGSAFQGNPVASLGALEVLADELVKQPGRSTMVASAAENGLKFARVPIGKTCDWCVMLGSRGFVYEARSSAGERRKFHGKCVLPGTLASGSPAVGATARWFEGEVLTIVSARGDELTVTPNHPILTGRGWQPAKLVHEGDEVFVSAGDERVLRSIPDEYDMPARIEDRFRSFAMVGDLASVPGSAEQFHGDGFDSEVHVVSRHRLLGYEVDPDAVQEIAEALFTSGASTCSHHRLLLNRGGALQCLLDGDGPAARSGIGGSGARRTLFRSHLGGAHLGSSGSVSGFDSASREVAVDGGPRYSVGLRQRFDAFTSKVSRGAVARNPGALRADLGYGLGPDFHSGLSQPSTDDGSRYAIRAGEGGHALPGDVPVGEIVRGLNAPTERSAVVMVERRGYVGHVFNLSTVGGWYFANTIVTHNCDCRIAIESEPTPGYDPEALYAQYAAARGD